MKQNIKYTLLSAVLFSLSAQLVKAETVPAKAEKQGYVAPFKMFDNLYYIGDQWVSAYLLVSNQGLILIDTLDMPYSKWIPENIKLLGLDPHDIKYILLTHPHSDHVAGAGYLQKMYRAKVVMLKQGLTLLAQQSAKNDFDIPTINLFPKDADSLILGNTEVRFYNTPGHTEGCMSLAFDVIENNTSNRAFVVCGNGTNFKGEKQAKNYISSVARIKQLVKTKPIVTVNLASHPHLGQLFERREHINASSGTNPFVDHKGMLYFLNLLEQRGKKKLAIEQAKKQKLHKQKSQRSVLSAGF